MVWLRWLTGIGFVAAAWVVMALTPPVDAREAPFAVIAEIGEPATGRNIEVTVTALHRASTATAQEWQAEGNWLVVDLDAAAVISDQAASLREVTFTIDGRTFSASERPDSILDESLLVGVPRSGSVAFELPAELTAGSGILTFALSTDSRLDSVIELAVDLDELPVEREVVLEPTEWTRG